MKTYPAIPEARVWLGERCCARIGSGMPSYARRIGARCGAVALDFRDIRVGGEPVQLALCRVHFRKLRDSGDPAALTLAWAAAGEFDGASKVGPLLADEVGA